LYQKKLTTKLNLLYFRIKEKTTEKFVIFSMVLNSYLGHCRQLATAVNAINPGVVVTIMLLAVYDIAFRFNLNTGQIGQFSTSFTRPRYDVVAVHCLMWSPKIVAIDTYSIVAVRPTRQKVVRLTFWPSLPMLIVSLTVIADAAETLKIHRLATMLPRNSGLDFGDRNDHLSHNRDLI
jgi:hypothetical protein